MAILKCKMCGGNLDIAAGQVIVECEYCGTKQTVPSLDNEKKLTLFSRANRLRFGCEFDKASSVYEAIVADFPEEAEAYWGLVLCKFGIEYVDDPATGKKIPTCHRSSFDSVMDDSNFEQTCEYADPLARRLYREEAKQIEDIRKGIIEVSGKEEPYDIFICYKETSELGDRTIDSVLAQDVYDALTAKGYRVFFSRITLEDKLGQEYEPYIFAALHSARVMLAFGTDYEYFNAVWVKNEWSRYLQLMAKDKTKHLIPCYKGIDAYDMPKEFARLQAQDMGKVGAVQDLLRGVEKLLPRQGAATVAPTTVIQSNANIDRILSRAYAYLAEESWNRADECFERVLEIDDVNIDALLGKLMAKIHCKSRDMLADCEQPFDNRQEYRDILQNANPPLQEELTRYNSDIRERNKQRQLRARRNIRIVICLMIIVLIVSAIGFYAYQQAPERTVLYSENSSTTVVITGLRDNIFNYTINMTGLLEIPSHLDGKTVTRIGVEAFKDCERLTKIIIPDSVINIGDRAFRGCTGLTEITIPDSVTSIGESAFRGCTGLTEITIPDSVTSIGKYAFSGCTGLTEITIPDSVTSIWAMAFSGCTGLTEIHYSGTMEQWKEISKFSAWNDDTGNYTIYCTDGNIEK